MVGTDGIQTHFSPLGSPFLWVSMRFHAGGMWVSSQATCNRTHGPLWARHSAWFSRYGPPTSSGGVTQERVTRTNSWTPRQMSAIRHSKSENQKCGLTSPWSNLDGVDVGAPLTQGSCWLSLTPGSQKSQDIGITVGFGWILNPLVAPQTNWTGMIQCGG